MYDGGKSYLGVKVHHYAMAQRSSTLNGGGGVHY